MARRPYGRATYSPDFSIQGEGICDLWKRHNPRYAGSHGRIMDARKLLIGEMRAPLPDVIAKRPDAEAFRVDTASKYVAVQQLLNMLSPAEQKRQVRLARSKTGVSDLAERTSSRIEKFINPATRNVLSDRDLTELLLVESEACALVVPEAARFRKVAGAYYEADGTTIRPDFRRDSGGQAYNLARDDAMSEQGRSFDPTKFDAEFGADEPRSRAAYDRYIKNLRARNYPYDLELLSRLQMIPINPRIRGDRVEVDGIISRTRLAPSEAIKRRYIIPGLDDHFEPTSDDEGDMQTGDLWLYLYVGEDQDANGNLYPYFSYSLGGYHTEIHRPGYEKGAVIDLRKQAGLRRKPISYNYGWRWFSVDPDKRGMPYTMPFGRSWLAIDAFLTGKTFAGWSEGMLAWFMEMPDSIKDTAMQQAWLDFVNTNPMTIEPFKVLPVWGTMKPAIHPGTGRDVGEMVAALQGSNSSELVNPLARGGGDAASAIERSVVSADTLLGVSDIRRSKLQMTAEIGEIILEVCAGVSKLHDCDVVIYGNPEQPSDESDSPTRAIIELKRHWLGPDGQESFDLEAFEPETLGDKLAEKAQLFGFWEKDAITDEDWCRAIGVDDPDRYMAQLTYQRWKKTPEALQVIMADAAQYLGDQDLIRVFEAQKSGALGGPNQQTPMGMLAGVNGPISDPGAQAATQMQNPAASQYAAIAGAARNADAAAVGPAPAMPAGMGV